MLHFAPRFGMVSPCLKWGPMRLRGLRCRTPANDNHAQPCANDEIETHEQALLEAALRMFAAHGLSAALRSGEAAEIAAAGGDHDGAAWWLEVCAALDGPLSRAIAARAHMARQIASR